MGLRRNTSRFHLEALVKAGTGDARQAQDRLPGARRLPGPRRRSQLLAEMLTSLIAGTRPEPGTAAETR
jgi:hypothetical protein